MAGILGSDEYYARQDGQAEVFVTTLYQDVLGGFPTGKGWHSGLISRPSSRTWRSLSVSSPAVSFGRP